MKKFLAIIFIIFTMSFTLTSCNLQFSDPDATIDNIINNDTIITTTQTQITETYSKVEPACVGVQASNDKSVSVGSGVIYRIVDKNNNKEVSDNTTDISAYVVTNEHVVNGKKKFRIYVDETKSYIADIIGTDKSNDLAILKFSSKYIKDELSYVPILSNEMTSPSQGTLALSIGCPLSLSNFNFPTIGLISKSTTTQIIHSCAINPGNSGGGLFDAATGQLIGINVSKQLYESQQDENGNVTQIPIDSIGFAIPIWLVKKVITDIESNNKDVIRPLLGVSVSLVLANTENESSNLLPSDLDSGVVILKVVDKSNASNAVCSDKNITGGLISGDVLVKISKTNIIRPQDLQYVMNTSTLGSTINLTVRRKVDGSWKTLEFLIKLV